jgi:hypothetical protein
VDQEFPNRDDDKNGQSDAIPDDTGFADFFLFDHAILLYALPPPGLVAGDFSPAGLFCGASLCGHHVFSGFVAGRAQLHE